MSTASAAPAGAVPPSSPPVFSHRQIQVIMIGLMSGMLLAALDGSIVGICDAFDAMTSTRPYRKGMSIEHALAQIQADLGRQFHPEWGKNSSNWAELVFLNA